MRLIAPLFTAVRSPRARRVFQSVPGVAAMGCTVVGVGLLAGVAWALIAAAPFLLILDWHAS